MPLYKYLCEDCEHVFTYLAMSVDDECEECECELCKTGNKEGCGCTKVSKQLTTAATHFKGGGWFQDGYGSSATTSDRGVKEANIRAQAKEEYQDIKTSEDRKAKEAGFVRVGTQQVENFPDQIIE